ncbi:hypothetical protein BCR33DRAFT_180844 [Rhizoclosmatium globosum]|uniref:Transposase Tc1-like domain-containing protein n=1 Tax=Rhizoclosmatium globosum TaxID=329046 RepID=A0A1Y2D0U4_9FUNG|nr:hypothetical protein BCR33DRAFT_180844 [Rhizoclosmatium globosum]|eukprot:ORY52892.1 hypothetical protein BCR33DRAFT_180844 [Rhizoclosmatium globosum]
MGHKRITSRIRELVINKHLAGLDPDVIKEHLEVSLTSIKRIVALWQHTGSSNTTQNFSGRPRSISQAARTYIITRLRAVPSLYLAELAALVSEAFATEINIYTLQRELLRMGISHKKV